MLRGAVGCKDTSMKSVYFFGRDVVEGDAQMRTELGGKGANLAEMTSLGIPVPPGFTIATTVCKHYLHAHSHTAELRAEVDAAMQQLEEATGRRFGELTGRLPFARWSCVRTRWSRNWKSRACR